MATPTLILSGIVLGTPDPQALASFYERLLGSAMPINDATTAHVRG